MSVADLRKEYTQRGLSERDLAADPFAQFQGWFDAALAAKLPEPNAMTLATASSDGRPAARIVLLKGVDERGFVLYTNYESRKGRDLSANPQAALVFYWPQLERQVRVEGRVVQLAPEESDAYFGSRPHGSQVGAWASAQSQVISGRAVLDERTEALNEQFRAGAVPRPPHWGGYRVVPDMVEFWQGRPSRLHDRLRYRLEGSLWVVERLSP